MVINLTELKTGESGEIVEVKGGFGFINKAGNLGIRKGKKIAKVSSYFRRGPQVIKVDSTQISLGYGMARKIMVEVK